MAGTETINYLSQGGTVASIALGLFFDQAIQCDTYAGDSSLEEINGESKCQIAKR